MGQIANKKPKGWPELGLAPALPRGPDHWLCSLKTKHYLKAASGCRSILARREHGVFAGLDIARAFSPGPALGRAASGLRTPARGGDTVSKADVGMTADATPAVQVFLNSLSKALRASSRLRGIGGPGFETWGPAAAAPFEVPSRATVTLGRNRPQSLALSFTGIRRGIGFRHWKRVEGSKWVHCLQQCNSALHLGQLPLKLTSGGRATEQL